MLTLQQLFTIVITAVFDSLQPVLGNPNRCIILVGIISRRRIEKGRIEKGCRPFPTQLICKQDELISDFTKIRYLHESILNLPT